MCNQIESVVHELSNINPAFVNMCEAGRFTYIMILKDKDVCEIISRLVHKLVHVRGFL